MTKLVSPTHIEEIVGVKRHRQAHYGRAVSSEKMVYILHSQRCLDSGIDLRWCRFSLALDRGIRTGDWDGYLDQPVILGVFQDVLFPVARVT